MVMVRLPDDLVERIDAERGGVPRERFVREVLGRALTEPGLVPALDRVRGSLGRLGSSAAKRSAARPK